MADKLIIPEAVDSERVVLGSILIEGTLAMKRIAHILTYHAFYDNSHRYVYRAMEKLFMEQQDIDTVTVYELLKEKGYVDMMGGPAYLTELTNQVTTSVHIVTHARIVAKRAVLRNIIYAARDITKMTQEEYEDLDDLLTRAEQRLNGVTREASNMENKLATVDLEDWRKIARETEERDGRVRGISTGIKGLDEMLEGFEPGEMFILTGHTKHGKSRLAANVAYNVAKQGKTVLFINTEMTKLQMGRRFNAMIGEEALSGKIILNDRSDLDARDVITIIERAKENGCDLVIVDHLHFFSRSVDNQTNEISKISKEFKEAAVTYEVPLLMLCHVQQGNTKKRPTLQMIKNSSSIAQDADIVVAVWTDDNPDGDNSMTEVIRLAHRSATKNKRKLFLYNDGMKLSEQSPDSRLDYDPNRLTEGGSSDDTNLGSW